MTWRLIHRRDQGGCGGLAFETDTDPQEMRRLKVKTTCWTCRQELGWHNWRLRNFREVR